jgi:hypothetical protein
MGPARIYPWKRMHRSRAPSIAPGTFFVAQSWADSITDMPGFNSRQAQGCVLEAAAIGPKVQQRSTSCDLSGKILTRPTSLRLCRPGRLACSRNGAWPSSISVQDTVNRSEKFSF